MIVCPNCSKPLETVRKPTGIYYACHGCGGRAVSVPLLHRVVNDKFVSRLWQRVLRTTIQSPKPCPFCTRWMLTVVTADPLLELDACKTCQTVWFDEREYENAPSAPAERLRPPDEAELRGRQIIAEYKVREMAKPEMVEDAELNLQLLPGLFGLPVESDGDPLSLRPCLTWILAVAIGAVSWVALTSHGRALFDEFALVPAQWSRWGGLTLLTSSMLHGGVIHLVSNLYFLLIFGDNVEAFLGRWRYIALLLLAVVAGDGAHILADPRATEPCVGASGGISGVIAFYALQFPHTRLGFLWRWFYSLRWVHLPAWFAFVLWMGLQFVGAYKQLGGFSNVSAFAHLGGAGVGVLFWLVWRNR